MNFSTTNMAALGRTARLGDLYDARSETFCNINLLKEQAPDCAVTTTDKYYVTETTCTENEDFSEKFNNLDVNVQLRISMAGVTQVDLSGGFLRNNTNSDRVIRSSLNYSIPTVVERLNLTNDQIQTCLSLSSQQNGTATHYVVEIKWGASAVVMFQANKKDINRTQTIQGSLRSSVQEFKDSISCAAETDISRRDNKRVEDFSIKVDCNLVAERGNLPQTTERARYFVKTLPEMIKGVNGGKGNPLYFTLLPLSELRKQFKTKIAGEKLLREIQEVAIARPYQLFDTIAAVKDELNSLAGGSSETKKASELDLPLTRTFQKSSFAPAAFSALEENGVDVAKLKPHEVERTVNLNSARRTIHELTKPLADISQNISTNIAVLKDRAQEVTNLLARQLDLSGKLYVPMIVLEPKPLDFPTTVCTAASCVSNVHDVVNNIWTIDYVTRCHENYAIQTQSEILNNRALMRCKVMNCTNCGCKWDVHMRITYINKQVSKQVPDVNIQSQIAGKEQRIKDVHTNIRTLQNRGKQLEIEQSTIVKVSSKLAHFLKHNAIVHYNDSLDSYLDHLIESEASKASAGGKSTALQGLKDMKKAYMNEKNLLEQAMINTKPGMDNVISIEEINELVKQLYSLPLCGQDLKKSVDLVRNGNQKLIQYHDEVCVPPRNTLREKIAEFFEPGKETLFEGTFTLYGIDQRQ